MEYNKGSGRSKACLSCDGQGNNMGVITDSVNLNISLKMTYGGLECDIAMLQNDMLMIL